MTRIARLRLGKLPVGRWIAPALGVFTPVAAGLAFMLDVASFQNLACRVPGVTGVCGANGWGGVPSEEQDRVWAAAIARSDGEGMRSYLRRWPKGAYADEAQARLAGCRNREVETWARDDRRLPLYVAVGASPQPSEAAARQEAMTRAGRDAHGLCVGFGQGEYRLAGAEAKPEGWRCNALSSGTVCGFTGHAVCKVEVRRMDVREVCH